MSPRGAGAVNAIQVGRAKGDCARSAVRAQSRLRCSMIVGVHPLAGFDKVLHYKVPESLRPMTRIGSLVRVPVGRAMRIGVVGGIGPPADFPLDRLKPVAQVVYPFPALTADLLVLARWMSVYYAAPMDAVIESMIPAAVRSG